MYGRRQKVATPLDGGDCNSCRVRASRRWRGVGTGSHAIGEDQRRLHHGPLLKPHLHGFIDNTGMIGPAEIIRKAGIGEPFFMSH